MQCLDKLLMKDTKSTKRAHAQFGELSKLMAQIGLGRCQGIPQPADGVVSISRQIAPFTTLEIP